MITGFLVTKFFFLCVNEITQKLVKKKKEDKNGEWKKIRTMRKVIYRWQKRDAEGLIARN